MHLTAYLHILVDAIVLRDCAHERTIQQAAEELAAREERFKRAIERIKLMERSP